MDPPIADLGDDWITVCHKRGKGRNRKRRNDQSGNGKETVCHKSRRGHKNRNGKGNERGNTRNCRNSKAPTRVRPKIKRVSKPQPSTKSSSAPVRVSAEVRRKRVNTHDTAKKPLPVPSEGCTRETNTTSNAKGNINSSIPAGKPVLPRAKDSHDPSAPTGVSETRTRGAASESSKKPLPVPSEGCTRDAPSNAKGNGDSSMPAGTPPRSKGTADGCASDSKQWANVVAKADGSGAPETLKVRANDWVKRLNVNSS